MPTPLELAAGILLAFALCTLMVGFARTKKDE